MLNDDVTKRLPDKIRKNAVLAVEMLYTASPEYFRPSNPGAAGTWEAGRFDSWKSAAMSYLRKQWGDRLVSATLHLDEATPHIHAIIVPLDSRGRLNCRDVFNRQALIDNQTGYASSLRHLGLVRGLEGSKAKHEDIKKYYGRVSAPPPQGAEARINVDGERERPAQDDERQRDVDRAKAAQFDAMRRRSDANARVITKLREEAALVRDLPLEPILEKLDAKRAANDKNLWMTGVGRVAVKGAKFFNHTLEVGGGGAIDIVMHLTDLPYREAVGWLGQNFGVAPAIGAAMARAKREAVLAAASPVHPILPPERSDSHWAAARNYLLRERCLDAATVDSAYTAGLIYADRHQNLVFMNSGKSGCELRGTRGHAFHGQRGKKGPFILPALSTGAAALVESGIDALSLRALGFVGKIVSFGGQAKNLIIEMALRLHEKGWEVISAFDNDAAGQKMADYVETALLGLSTPKRMSPKGKDWNDDLRQKERLILGNKAAVVRRHSPPNTDHEI